jgi:hypothetical protein
MIKLKKLIGEVLLKGKDFMVLGRIDDDCNIDSLWTKNTETNHHQIVGKTSPFHSYHWRYNSIDNKVGWWIDGKIVSSDNTFKIYIYAVDQFLLDRYHISEPEHISIYDTPIRYR